MSTKLYTLNVPFTQVPNVIINDLGLSLKAKGLFVYLQSKPDGWRFSINGMKHQLKEGKEALQSAIKELEQAGYLKRHNYNDEKTGRWRTDYYLFAEPQPGNHATVKLRDGETRSLSNKDISNKDISKKEVNKGKQGLPGEGILVSEIIKAFESVDPKNKTFYGHKTQRAACLFLIEEYGLDEVKKRISFLPKTNKQPYFPTITTPCQLRDKWVQLEDAITRYKSKRIEANPVAF